MKHRAGRKIGWLLAAVPVGLGLLLRLVYLHQYGKSPLFEQIIGPDVAEYEAWARRILAGELLWRKVDIHAPLYPYYLALLDWICGWRIYAVRLLQLLVALAAFLPLWLELRRRYRSGLAGWLPTAFLTFGAVYPPMIFYTGEMISEALMLPLLCLALAALYRGDRSSWQVRRFCYSAAGLCCGLAVITHPLSLCFPLLFGVLMLWRLWRSRGAVRRHKLLLAVIFAVAVAAPVIPVSIYNSLLLHSPVLVQKNSGYNFYLGNNPEATGGCYIWPGPEWDRVHRHAADEAQRLGISKDRYFLLQSWTFIREQPLAWSGKLLLKAVYTWNRLELAAGPDLPYLKYYTGLMRNTGWASGVLLTLALAGLGIIAGCRTDRVRGRYFLILVLSSWAVLTLTVVGGRYRLMMLPGVLFLAAWMVTAGLDLWRRRGMARLLLVPALAAAGALVWLPQPQVDDRMEDAHAYTIMGEAYLNSGNRTEALRCLLVAEKTLFRWSRSYNILGRIYERTQPALAEEYFRQAIKVSPEEAYGYMNLGNLASERHDFAGAAKWFNTALKLGGDDPQVLYNVAIFELRRGNLVPAADYLQRTLRERPDDRRAINNLAVIALMSGKAGEAIKWLDRALTLEPRNADLMVNMAAACWQDGRSGEAEAWLTRALRLQPGHRAASEMKRRLAAERR